MTAMTKPAFDANGGLVRRWMSLTPMKRPGQPEELGGAIA